MRTNDDEYYQIVADEIQRQYLVSGLWAKAFSSTQGKTEKAKALYIGLRVRQLKDAAQQEYKELKQREKEANNRKGHFLTTFLVLIILILILPGLIYFVVKLITHLTAPN